MTLAVQAADAASDSAKPPGALQKCTGVHRPYKRVRSRQPETTETLPEGFNVRPRPSPRGAEKYCASDSAARFGGGSQRFA